MSSALEEPRRSEVDDIPTGSSTLSGPASQEEEIFEGVGSTGSWELITNHARDKQVSHEPVRHDAPLGSDCTKRAFYETDTALIAAITSMDMDTVRLLLEKGADANGTSGNRPLSHAINQKDGSKEMTRLLLDQGARLELEPNFARTGLHWAAFWNSPRIAKLLIDNGADLEGMNDDRCTPLEVATRRGSVAVFELLLQHGAKVDLRAGAEHTLLQWAAMNNSIEMTEALLVQGVNLEALGGKGGTALLVAVNHNRLDVVKCLLKHGADPSKAIILDEHLPPCSAIDAAISHRHHDVLRLLLDHACNSSEQTHLLNLAIDREDRDATSILLEALGGSHHPIASVALEIAFTKGDHRLETIMRTASLMYPHVGLREGEYPGDYAWLDWVLQQGGPLVKNCAMHSLLEYAVREKDTALLITLVHQGCDIDAELRCGVVPLVEAMRHDDTEMIEVLLEAGAELDETAVKDIPDFE